MAGKQEAIKRFLGIFGVKKQGGGVGKGKPEEGGIEEKYEREQMGLGPTWMYRRRDIARGETDD